MSDISRWPENPGNRVRMKSQLPYQTASPMASLMLLGHNEGTDAAPDPETEGRVGSSGSAPTAGTGSPSHWSWQRPAPRCLIGVSSKNKAWSGPLGWDELALIPVERCHLCSCWRGHCSAHRAEASGRSENFTLMAHGANAPAGCEQ